MKQWEREYPLGALLVKGFTTAGEIFLYGWVVFFFWNYIMPKFGIPAFTSYWHALAMFILSRFLLNDHILTPEPVVVHCDCTEEVTNACSIHPVEEKK